MHTIMVVTGGLVLLLALCVIGHVRGGASGIGGAARLFLPVWLVVSVINLAVGVRSAGYTVAEELPVLLVIFGVPAAAAIVVLWWVRNR
jgi:hypothetical protein